MMTIQQQHLQRNPLAERGKRLKFCEIIVEQHVCVKNKLTHHANTIILNNAKSESNGEGGGEAEGGDGNEGESQVLDVECFYNATNTRICIASFNVTIRKVEAAGDATDSSDSDR